MQGQPQSQHQPWIEYANDTGVVTRFFNMVYAWMAAGIAYTGLVAWIASQNPTFLQLMYGYGPMVPIIVLLVAFALSWFVQSKALELPFGAGVFLFFVYATLMGAVLAYVPIVYPLATIGSALFMTAGVFGVMSIYGFVTKRDLTGIGSIAVMGAFGLIAASFVNALVIGSPSFSWFITYGILAVFIIITAYETQMLKNMAVELGNNSELAQRAAIIGALVLYVSFLNIFLSILRILGDRE